MAIRYIEQDRTFWLDTEHTSYIMAVVDEENFVGHVYYGQKLQYTEGTPAPVYLMRTGEAPFVPSKNNRERVSFLDSFPMEYPGNGLGDYRESAVSIRTVGGHVGVQLNYVSHEIVKEKPALPGLPSTFPGEEDCDTLILHLEDQTTGLTAELIYTTFEKVDVITRSVILKNTAEQPIYLTKVMSACLDLDCTDEKYDILTLHGSWGRERQMERRSLMHGKQSVGSVRGESSHQEHPFIALLSENATQDTGEVYGMHFVYSGNFLAQAELSQFDSIRMTMGIHPENFVWKLEQGESFAAPEVVMTYSSEGISGMTHHYHDMYREHLIRGEYRDKKRPILINNWEATYFDFNTDKLLKIAKQASKLGIEMLVMDDGWFGHRNDDSTSLGDWKVNEQKLPGGLKLLVDQVNAMGLKFGIWFEPEMISPDSDLYREHPDWAMTIPGHPHSEGRNQRLLDLCNPEVQQYVIDSITKVFSSGDIRYAKWDMNRIFSDIYAPSLPAERQGETAHRYVLGLYQIMEELTTRFPKILFEGCSAGGNRFDLGILCYFPQIWASDNTDALCRTEIQNSYSYGYPLSVFTAHVSSCPNHQTLRITPLETRFQVASFGVLGYECNLKDLSGSDLNAIREQITLYKKWRDVFQFGTFYRGTENEDADSETLSWTCVSPDGRRAVGLFFRRLAVPNQSHDWYRPVGLLPDVKYHFYGRNIKYNLKDFGDLVNTVSPVHIKQGSALQEILSRFVNMDGEKEELTAYGDTLMRAGIALKPAFAGTGYNSDTRLFPDFSSRIYFMEAVE